jgi:ABC-type thiamine transport system substrate-binding protein
VPEGRFLRKLEEVVDWELFTPKLVRLYRGRAERGRPPYNPVVILKILVLSYLYDLSQRQVEVYVNDSLSAKWFLGMAVDEAVMAMDKGVESGATQVVDSRHTLADVNVPKRTFDTWSILVGVHAVECSERPENGSLSAEDAKHRVLFGPQNAS